MSDPLVDNKTLYFLEINFIKVFSWITKLIFILFIIGFFQSKPTSFLRVNSIIKILLGMFLIYRFNKYRVKNISFTELDQKVAYSAGIYIVLLSFADILDSYVIEIRSYIMPYTNPIIQYFQNLLEKLYSKKM
jgi:hypothetical protein